MIELVNFQQLASQPQKNREREDGLILMRIESEEEKKDLILEGEK